MSIVVKNVRGAEEMLCATQVRGYGADTARTEPQKG